MVVLSGGRLGSKEVGEEPRVLAQSRKYSRDVGSSRRRGFGGRSLDWLEERQGWTPVVPSGTLVRGGEGCVKYKGRFQGTKGSPLVVGIPTSPLIPRVNLALGRPFTSL